MSRADAMEGLADLLGALGHPDRLRLILVLGEGERDVASLAGAVGISQPRTSQHLKLLKAHHLLSSRREGRRVLYTLERTDLLPWLAGAAAFLEEDAARTAALADDFGRLIDALQTG